MDILLTEEQFKNIIKSKKHNRFHELLIKHLYKPTKHRAFYLWGIYKHVKNWPKIKYDGGEGTLDLENNEIVKLTNDKLVFLSNGDWQPEHVVTVKLVNDKLTVTDCKPSKHVKVIHKEKDLLNILGLTDDYKQKRDEIIQKETDEKIERFYNEYIDWNTQGGTEIGYKTPTKTSVLEFFQNHHEQYNENKKIQSLLLKKLMDNKC